MNKMNKKGFTIVELVIVIAVIAILAGVLIPTFGGIIDRANESAAMQKVAAAYKEAYAIALADDGKIDSTDFTTDTAATDDGDKKCIKVDDFEFTWEYDSTNKVDKWFAKGVGEDTDDYTYEYKEGAWTAKKA